MPNESTSMKKYIFMFIGVVILLAIYTWISNPLIVTVAGVGDVSVPPTKAIISLSANEINSSPVAAAQNLQAKVNILKATLVQNGVLENEIVESQISISPAAVLVPGAQGYAASATLGGPTTDVQNVSNLTASLYEKGATLVSQPVLQTEDQEKLEKEALSAAMADAKKKANSIGTSKLRFLRRAGAISVLDTPTTGSYTSKGDEESDFATGNTFKITKAVQVTYRMW